MEEIQDVLESTWFSHKRGMGKWVLKLEGKLASRRGWRHCCLYGAGHPRLLKELLQLNHCELQEKEFTEFPSIPSPWCIYLDSHSDWNLAKQMGNGGYDENTDYLHRFAGMNWRPSELTAALLHGLLRNGQLAEVVLE